MKKILSLFAMAAFAVASMAQVPEAFSYSCQLADKNGALLKNKEVSVMVTVEVNMDMYEETHTVTTNDNGVAAFIIGKGQALNPQKDLGSLPWSSFQTSSMQVQIDPEGGSNYTISGKTNLTSVPFALVAGSAARSGYAEQAGFSLKANEASKVGDMEMAKVSISVDDAAGTGLSITIMGTTIKGGDEPLEVLVPAYSPIYYSIESNGKYYTIALNDEYIYDEKLSYRETAGVMTHKLLSKDVADLTDINGEYMFAAASGEGSGLSGELQLAGRVSLLNKNKVVEIGSSIDQKDVDALTVPSYTLSMFTKNTNGISYTTKSVIRENGSRLGYDSVKNRLVGPFSPYKSVNTIVVKTYPNTNNLPPVY